MHNNPVHLWGGLTLSRPSKVLIQGLAADAQVAGNGGATVTTVRLVPCYEGSCLLNRKRSLVDLFASRRFDLSVNWFTE
jgi:hypothetical protein